MTNVPLQALATAPQPNAAASTPFDHGPDGVFDVLTPREVGRLVRSALDAVALGTAYGTKAVLQPGEGELLALIEEDSLEARFADERLNWKLSALVSVNDLYGAVKIVGSNAYNRVLGLSRSRSTILLYDKLTMQPLSVLDGTAISAARTGAYASIVADLLLKGRERVSVFLFGAGRIAETIVDDLEAHHGGRIDTVYVKSRRIESARAFATAAGPRVSFKVVAVEDLAALPACAFVVTASNTRKPMFEADQVADDAVVLHLGGDETPPAFIRRALESGTVLCDDVHTVCHRNSQSLALYFSRNGGTLEAAANTYQVGDLWRVLREPAETYRTPALVTCVGLPVLDLYLAQRVYEAGLAGTVDRQAA